MQNKVGQMITARFQAVKLIVEHQGQPRQRMPEFSMESCECPTNSLQRDALLDIIVLCDISRVIEINETVTQYPAISNAGGNYQKNNDEISMLFIHKQQLIILLPFFNFQRYSQRSPSIIIIRIQINSCAKLFDCFLQFTAISEGRP